MKLKILRFSIISLSLVITAIVLRSAGAQGFDGSHSTQTATVAATQEKTTEQVQKNIKVLTGMPQSQLIPVMNFFAASVGRRCNFCHVNNNGQWDYASDAKPEKNTAREMIKLVLDTNKTLTRLKLDPISCYGCHRGRTSPQSVPTLPLPLPSPGAAGSAAAPGGAQAQASPSPRPELPSADDIFAKYTQSLGGQAAIDKLKSRVSKGTLTQANGNVLQFEAYQVAPDKYYQVVTTPQGAFERGYNGSVGWEKNARGVRELLPAEVAQLKANSGLFSLINLKGQLTQPRVTKDKIGDRDVYVITGTTADGGRQRLFFDAESGLLLRRITYTSTMVATIPEEVDFEDYRDTEGIKFPFTARSSTIEVGNPISTRKFTEVKLNVPVDDSKFNMPAAASKPAAPPELTMASQEEMGKHIGQIVTLRGRFLTRGKGGPFILVGTHPIYLQSASAAQLNARYAEFEGHDVRVTGVLRFAQASEGIKGPDFATGLAAHFYIESETAKLELSPA